MATWSKVSLLSDASSAFLSVSSQLSSFPSTPGTDATLATLVLNCMRDARSKRLTYRSKYSTYSLAVHMTCGSSSEGNMVEKAVLTEDEVSRHSS